MHAFLGALRYPLLLLSSSWGWEFAFTLRLSLGGGVFQFGTICLRPVISQLA